MPAMGPCEQLRYGGGLAVGAHRQDYSFIGPVHGPMLQESQALVT